MSRKAHGEARDERRMLAKGPKHERYRRAWNRKEQKWRSP